MRGDRLISIVLLLQSKGRLTTKELARAAGSFRKNDSQRYGSS